MTLTSDSSLVLWTLSVMSSLPETPFHLSFVSHLQSFQASLGCCVFQEALPDRQLGCAPHTTLGCIGDSFLITGSNMASGCPAGRPGEGTKLHPRMEHRLCSLGDKGVWIQTPISTSRYSVKCGSPF